MNAALHGYDRILLTVRSGYLTIFFGGWAILLSGVAQEKTTLVLALVIAAALLTFSIGLSVGGFIIDCNYVIRKFRAIHDLNLLLEHVLENPKIESVEEAKDLDLELLKGVIRVSGVSGEYNEEGWKAALMVSIVFYFVPIIILGVSLLVTWLLDLWSIRDVTADIAHALLA